MMRVLAHLMERSSFIRADRPYFVKPIVSEDIGGICIKIEKYLVMPEPDVLAGITSQVVSPRVPGDFVGHVRFAVFMHDVID
jgi:hypothetical protein